RHASGACVSRGSDRCGGLWSRSLRLVRFVFFFFFFQAEDGIRDLYVTGVQTCALPILRNKARGYTHEAQSALRGRAESGSGQFRSEERRVGKECRCRWATGREKKR